MQRTDPLSSSNAALGRVKLERAKSYRSLSEFASHTISMETEENAKLQRRVAELEQKIKEERLAYKERLNGKETTIEALKGRVSALKGEVESLQPAKRLLEFHQDTLQQYLTTRQHLSPRSLRIKISMQQQVLEFIKDPDGKQKDEEFWIRYKKLLS